MGTHPLRVLSLFSGYGGLDIGIRLAASSARTIAYVEREAYACAILAARMSDGGLDDAPIWSDVSTFDGRPWRGCVDLITGGFPCQDISNAGKRAGIEGERSGLWSEFARIIGEVRPRYVFLENVSALVVRGLDRVLGDLAALGFDAEWDCFRASDHIGAPHRRERIFVLAYSRCEREPGRRKLGDMELQAGNPEGEGRQRERLRDTAGNGGADVADSDSQRRQGDEWRARTCRQSVASGRGEALAQQQQQRCQGIIPAGPEARPTERVGGTGVGNPEGVRRSQAQRGQPEGRGSDAADDVMEYPASLQLQGQSHSGTGRVRSPSEALEHSPIQPERESNDAPSTDARHEPRADAGRGCVGLPYWPPGPAGNWTGIEEDAQPAICRLADGAPDWLVEAHANRPDQLRLLGNGVVPLVAAVALVTLARRVGLVELTEEARP